MNLLTVYGPVDLLGTAGEGLGYEELLPNSPEIEIDDFLRIRVLDLETIISIKEQDWLGERFSRPSHAAQHVRRAETQQVLTPPTLRYRKLSFSGVSMFDRNRTALPLLLLLAPSAFLYAQEPAVAGAGARAANDKAVTAAAIAGAKVDPKAYERGTALYASSCAGCHGPTGHGGPGAPDLVRSLVVLDDEKGILIAPVLRDGRPDAGMPKPGLTEAQIADLVDWLHVQTYAADHRSTYAFQDVLTGDPKKGEAYFKATCGGCHSATGDLKGIGARYDGFRAAGALAATARRDVAAEAAAAGAADVAAASGVGPRRDHCHGNATIGAEGFRHARPRRRFQRLLRDSAGEYHSFTRDGAVPKVEINDPLKPHTDLLAKYTDADIHNITAYLVTLK